MDRRTFTRVTAAAFVGAALAGSKLTSAIAASSGPLAGKHLNIGMLIFSRMDQIDFTGPFSVLSRLPDSTVHVIAEELQPIRDHKGLVLTPEKTFASMPEVDLLVIPGGPGQEALMGNEPVLSLIRNQFASGRLLFSVCTGALICGAAGVLRGRKATTHWSALGLLEYFGAVPQDSRVCVDGNLVSAAGVTAGIDGALTLAALLRGAAVAQQIQLDIQYAPEPPFNAGTPKTAPSEILDAMRAKYKPLTDARLITARRVRERLGIAPSP